MDKLTVIDGDFNQHVGHILNMNPLEPLFDLQILKTNRHAVYKTHLDYLRAGAKIIRTNTCRATTKFLMKYLHITRFNAKCITAAAVRVAKMAVMNYYEETGGDIFDVETFRKRRALVAGCCSSYAISRIDQDGPVQYWNFIPRRVIIAQHYSHIKALLKAGVDLLAFESIPSLMEAKAIIMTLTEFPEIRAWITLLCSPEGKLADGNTFAEAATYCYDSLPGQIIAIGADCPFPNLVKSLVRSINENRDSKIPFLFRIEKDYLSIMEHSDEYGTKIWNDLLQECLDIGICYIGGGYNTIAEDIRKICEQIKIYHISKDSTVASVSQNEENLLNQ